MTKMDGRSLRKLLKAAIEAVAPDLRKTMALPRKARVTAVKPAGGTYYCSVQPVLNDGRPDPAAPVIPDVEIPCVWAGPDRGLICPPMVGEYCDLGFYDGDPTSPFIMSFRPSSAPAADLDELMIQHSPGIRLGFKADGTVIVEAPKIEAKAAVAEAVAKAADKPGTIKMWSGKLTEIETGWALCDGSNGRPDLRDCFIMGAGGTYQVGAKGGSASHSHSLSGSVGDRTLTIAQMPAHTHMVTTIGSGPIKNDDGSNSDTYFGPRETSSTGGGQSHDHPLTLSGGQASNLPVFYALAFIIKL